jgi:outer membrane protein assembly factor BamA/autotransporter translocation and assembly factor TamB
MSRRGRFIAVFVVAAIVLVVLVLLGFLPQDVLRRYVEKRLQSGLGAGSSIGRMHTVPGRLSTDVEDVVIQGPTYRLTLPKARIVLAPTFLFGKGLSFVSVELDSPRLEITAGADTTDSAAVNQQVLIHSLSVTNATIVYHLGLQNQLTLTGVSMRGAVGEGTLDVAAKGGTWQRDTTVALGPVTGRLRVSSRLDIAIDTLQADVLHSHVEVSGTLGRIGALNPDLRLQARLDLRDLRSFGLDADISGRITAAGRLSGTGEALTLDTKIEGGQLKISSLPVDHIEAHVVHKGGLQGRTDVSLEAALLGGRTGGVVRLRGRETDADLKFGGIDVVRLREAGVSVPWPPAGRVGGTLNASGDWQAALHVKATVDTTGAAAGDLALQAHLEASGAVRLASRTLDVGFELKLDGTRPAAGSLPRLRSADLVARGQARGTFPPAVDATVDGSLSVETLSGTEAVPVTGHVRYAGGVLTGDAQAHGLGGTLDASAEASGSVIRRLEVQGRSVQLGLLRPEAEGLADFHLSASGPTDRLSGTADVDVDALLWNKQAVGPLTARLDGVLGRAQYTFAAPDLRVSGKGTADRQTVQATLTLDQTQVERIAALVPLTQALTGVASGTVDVSFPVANPAAMIADAHLDTLELASGGITARATQPVVARLRDRVLEFTTVQLEGNGVTASASGRVGLDAAAPIAAHVVFDADVARAPHPEDITVTGAVHGDVTVDGTRERPRAEGAVTLAGISAQRSGQTLATLEDGSLNLQGDVAVVQNVRGTVGGGTVELTGTIPVAAILPAAGAQRLGLTTGVEADLDLRWQDVQAASVLALLRPGASSIQAVLNGDARVQGTAGTWRDAHGEVTLTPTNVRIQDLDLQVAPITARIEAGRVTTDGLVVNTAGSQFRVDGSADLRALTFQAAGHGVLELRTLSPLLSDASLTGLADVDVTASGPFRSPQAQGTIKIRDGTLRERDIRQPLTGINALVTVDERTIRLTDGTATLGGGPVTMQGTARLDGLSVSDVDVTLKATAVGLRYPVGGKGGGVRQILSDLKARVNADLTLTGKPGDFLLAGSVAVERSLYDTDIFFEDTLLAPSVPPGGEQASTLLQSIGLNLAVVTTNPFIVRNNLAQIEAEGGLSVRGDMANPSPFGRFDILPGGKIFLQTREFAVEDGYLMYTGTTDPAVNVRATTVIKDPAQDVEVTVVVSGAMPQISLDLSSTPSLSQQEIASLVATGRSDATVASDGWIVGEQAGALLLGRFTRAVSKQLLGLGFDQVDIQPELLAREGNPSARFTFGKQLTSNLRLIYSNGLSNPEEQYYEAQFGFRLGQQITFKLQRQFDGSYQYGAGQRLTFGGPPRKPAAKTSFAPTELRDVRLEGELTELPDVLQAAKAHKGSKVTYWDLLDDADRIRQRLVNQGYLESVVDARLDDDVAVFTGVAGMRHRWSVAGLPNPPNIDSIMKSALFEEEGTDKAREALLEEARRRGFLRATVDVQSSMQDGYHTMVFQVQPGPALTADVTFPGASVLSQKALLAASGGAAALLTRPPDAEEGIRAAYRQARHLVAKVGPTRVVDEPGVVRITVPVEEGLEATVAAIKFTGITRPEDELVKIAALPTGGRYDPSAVDQAVLRLRERYLTLGHAAVRVNPRVEQAGADLDIVFDVNEGMAQTIGPNIAVHGLKKTRERLVRAQLRRLRPGQPLDPRKLAEAERRLRDLGIFRRVVVTASQDPVAAITVELEEGAPYTAAYDVRYNRQDALNASVDGQVQNLFGRAVALGLRVQAGRYIQEERASLHLPSVWRLGDLTVSTFNLRQSIRTAFEQTGTEAPPPLDVQRRVERGIQLQQAVHRFRPYEILYGYRYSRLTCPGEGLPAVTHTIRGIVDPCDRSNLERAAPLGPNPISIDVGALDGSVVRDTRDNPLNATRGMFISLNLSVAPRVLGTDFNYVRELLQASYNHGLGPTMTWSQRISVGTIYTFGEDRLPVNDLFKAGGSSTVRGFGTDSLGPQTTAGEALGGAATLIVNEELRYQHASGLGAAVFYDAGNVYPRLQDFNLSLRHSVGAGLRYASGFGLIRLDFAFPLDRRPEDRSFQFWFGFGQIF